MKTPLIALAAAATALTATPALAGETERNMVVSYQDLDLSTEAGQKTLQSRINAAAKKFCGVGAIQTGSRVTSKASTKCFKEARRLANQQFAVILDDARLGG